MLCKSCKYHIGRLVAYMKDKTVNLLKPEYNCEGGDCNGEVREKYQKAHDSLIDNRRIKTNITQHTSLLDLHRYREDSRPQ